MKKGWTLTQEAFDALLVWLSPNREEAGVRYETIRQSLVIFFLTRGCSDPETLADEVINRVSLKINTLNSDYVGSRTPYFYGVARRIYQEYQNANKLSPEILKESMSVIRVEFNSELIEIEHQCLDEALLRLKKANRDLVMNYYNYDPQTRAEERLILAQKLGITVSHLRVKAHRIVVSLQSVVENCIKAKTEKRCHDCWEKDRG